MKLAGLVPWDVAEERYAARFVNNGHPAHPARMALGALLIQQRMKCSDQWLAKHIGENPYLQYFIRLSRSKKRSGKAIRSVIRKQLQYVRRDIGHVAKLLQTGGKLTAKQAERMNIVTTVYEQQRIMFEIGTQSIPRRIVSLTKPWVHPIVRGKARANTEFGVKLHNSLVEGYARIERLDLEPFNESYTRYVRTITLEHRS